MMTTHTQLGKITSATFGWGGYDGAMIGLSIGLGGESWDCGDFKGAWGIDRSDHAQWTERDRKEQLGHACMFLRDVLRNAKKQTVDQLVGVPVEVTFDDNRMISWRVLEEVL
jgi:hypothetical protein